MIYTRGGFTFCGLDIADVGLEYAPELSNTYVYNVGSRSIQEQIIETHEGGYFYGATTNVKDFILRCYYESKNVRGGIMSKINHYFRVGKTGKLVFAKREWCWYTATVINLDTTNMFNYENGFVVIKMRAYYPYARSDIKIVPIDAQITNDVMLNSAMLDDEDKMPQTNFGYASERITTQQSFVLYNPGTERAKVAIEIAGNVGSGVSIANSTTNQLCKFVALSDAITTSVNKYLISDALNGKTVLTNGTQAGTSLAFLYHDNGFIELEPAYPILRNIRVYYAANATTISISNIIDEDIVGKYIYIDGAWRKIVSQLDPQHYDSALYDESLYDINCEYTISSAPTHSGTEKTEVVTMNEITVVPDSTMSLSKLNFVYLPTFS